MGNAVSAYAAEIRSWLRQNGIRPVDRLDRTIEGTFGMAEGGRIIDETSYLFDLRDQRLRTEGRTGRHVFRDTAMVEAVNQNRQLSMIFAGFYDWAIFRQVMDRLCGIPDCFAGEVFDLGCGNGLITNFLARHYPGADFTGADISRRALVIAREIAEENGISNVSYVEQKALTEDTDTLLSIRTLHENLPAPEEIAAWTAAVRDYVPRWTAHVRVGGHLALFERVPVKSAWMLVEEALADCGFALRPDAQDWVSCRAGDDIGKFRFAVFDRRAGQRV